MINVKRYDDGRFFSIEDNQKEKKFKLFDFKGKERTVKKSCALCRFADLNDSEEFFICTIDNIVLNEDLMKKSCCNQFDISDLMLDDLFVRCQ